ncbi:DUF4381 domain-containing protein [Xanthomonas maliensis]|uniref:DUF4381 domain-containing protein n=1 Tax=Xanthomonas maliensis TaxID=1321368 RepID=UPI00039F0F20|nr:DUF4381 domain-containing protein [Xanthomonas maliensis]KAB7762896.1 DUF4381 domain-containing protein [Xanthomonas maliensis]
MAPGKLPLRDVHLPPTPSWWPLAPGWWGVLAVVALVGGLLVYLRWRRYRRERAWLALFDAELAVAGSVAQRLVVLSGLLRRAARRCDPRADRLQGEDWLRFLDGHKGQAFSQGPGRVLLDGGFQRAPLVADPEALQELARVRFLALMRGRR